MYINQLIGIADNALPSYVCDDIVEFFESKAEGATHQDTAYRNDFGMDGLFRYSSFKKMDKKIRECLREGYANYFDLLGENGGLPHHSIANDFLADYKVQKAESGGGFFGWHAEQGPGKEVSKRFLTWMIYLNNVKSTGSTDFYHQKLSVTPKKGTLVIWPAAFTHLHRSNPNLKQDKYLATGWWVL